MNKDQFIYWLKGFVDAAQVSPTQIQWGIIKEKLDEIKDCPDFGSSIGVGGLGVVNTKSIITDGFIQNVSATINPPFTLTTTSTAYGHASGSTVSYTANLPEEL